MANKANTPALKQLENQQVSFILHTYELTADADTYGQAVAAELGIDPHRLFKTLVAVVDGNPVVGVVPAAARLSLKSLARAAGGKRGAMAEPGDAERWTGYVTGGISPFGQKRLLPMFVDLSISAFETVYASAGQRGMQVELAPTDMVRILDATLAHISDD